MRSIKKNFILSIDLFKKNFPAWNLFNQNYLAKFVCLQIFLKPKQIFFKGNAILKREKELITTFPQKIHSFIH